MRFVTIIPFILTALFLVLPQQLLAWGSLAPAETHQYILRKAYEKLSADPAFDRKRFPTIDEIVANEGVKWVEADMSGNGLIGAVTGIGVKALSGAGPDSAGASRFSEHYYNYKIGQGGGPESVARYYRYLAEAALTGKSASLAKSAAYGAHFLADMFCPYHVVGCDRATIKKIFDEQNAKHPGTVYLYDDIKGSVKLSYMTPVKFLSNNFHTEVKRYLELSKEDWFDPWYYNGTSEYGMSDTSSHIVWETLVGHNVAGLSGYDPAWKNSSATFNSPWNSQSAQARQLAILSATETSQRINSYVVNPDPAVNNAIQAVATYWRATFSALRPSVETTAKDNSIVLKVKLQNSGNAAASNVGFRINPGACQFDGPSTPPAIQSIPAGQTVFSQPVRLKAQPGQSCNVKVEVSGAYAAPDLQYAAVTRTVKNDGKPEPTPLAATTDTAASALSLDVLKKLAATVKVEVGVYGPIEQTVSNGTGKKYWENIAGPNNLFFVDAEKSKSFPLSWGGTSFSGSTSAESVYFGRKRTVTVKVSGSISSDGMMLNNLTFEEKYLEERNYDASIKIRVANVPFSKEEYDRFGRDGMITYKIHKPEAKSSIISAERTFRYLDGNNNPKPGGSYLDVVRFFDAKYEPQVLINFNPYRK